MKLIFCMTLCIAALSSSWASSQDGEIHPKQSHGYARFTPGATLGDGVAATLTLGAGAEGLIKRGFGASADVSYLFYPAGGFNEGFGLFSPGRDLPVQSGPQVYPFCHGRILASLPRRSDQPDSLWRRVQPLV